MKQLSRALLAAVALALAACSAPAQDRPEVVVYKTATCGCCTKWVEHLRAQGFTVQAHDVSQQELDAQKQGVPASLASCHTARVGPYLIEGHVPAEDIHRLLAERPELAGLAVPEMPIGSPGMEGPNPVRYRVLGFDSEGRVSEFASHAP